MKETGALGPGTCNMETALGTHFAPTGRQIVSVSSSMTSSAFQTVATHPYREKNGMRNLLVGSLPTRLVSLSAPTLAHQLCRPPIWVVRSTRGISTVKAYGRTEGSPPKEPSSIVLRRLLNTPGVHQGPACYDALSAKLVETAGFDLAFISGQWLPRTV